jgi:AcrR family transcriptional regulator
MPRMSAAARREDVVGIAFRHFAEGGFDGTSTEDIAREAGVSQPYLFRLFKTKRGLYEACVDQCFERVEAVFAGAVAGATPEERFAAMGRAYGEQLLPDRHALLFQMRAYAVADPEIRAYVRAKFERLRQAVADLAGVAPADTWGFFGDGMLFNVVAMLEFDWVFPE